MRWNFVPSHARRCHVVAGRWPATTWMHYTTSCNTQSSAPEDGQNNCPKHVDLIGVINKPLLLHLVGCLYHLYQRCTVKQISKAQCSVLSTRYAVHVQNCMWYGLKGHKNLLSLASLQHQRYCVWMSVFMRH